MKRRRLFVVIAVLALTATAALAQIGEKPELVLTLMAQKEVVTIGTDGTPQTAYQEARNTKPGDVLKYTIRYQNAGKAEARGAKILDPVPQSTSYVGGSAEGENADLLFSLDGKTFRHPEQLTYKVRQSDGTEVEYIATPDMYTHVQWILRQPVPPGGEGMVSFKVKVN